MCVASYSPLNPPFPEQSLTQEKQWQMFQEHTMALPPTPPICTGSAVNPRKELTTQARTYTYKAHRCPHLFGLNSCPTEWTLTQCDQIPCLIAGTQRSGLVSASRVQCPWAAGRANPSAWGLCLSNQRPKTPRGTGQGSREVTTLVKSVHKYMVF